MALFERFERWQDADFDAFAEPKWASNRFNPERQRVRERLRSLLEQAVALQPEVADGLELWTSRHEPNFFNQHAVQHQLALLTRPAAQREALEARDATLSATQPDRYHPHIGLKIDTSGIGLVVRVPAEASYDLPELPPQLLETAQELAGMLGVEAATGTLEIERRWPREQALQAQDSIEQLAQWLALTGPMLRQALRPVGANPTPAAPQPADAAALTPPPAKTQATARPWQPYRPQAPAAPRRAPPAERPSLERILPMGTRQLLQEQLAAEVRSDERRSDWRDDRRPDPRDDRRPDPRDSRWPDRRQGPGPLDPRSAPRDDRRTGPEPRRDAHPDSRTDRQWQGPPRGDSRQDYRHDPRDPRHDPRQDPRHDARRDPRQDARHDPRSDPRANAAPPRPTAPAVAVGTQVVLTAGLLAGKEGAVVATQAGKVKVKVGALEFDVPAFQVKAL
ncbi:MAG: hypothetical protein HY902_15175 [Deltaproteobacteria bacterium]|nr:hypothetical protein [Deltaproteobacteria bacterium]